MEQIGLFLNAVTIVLDIVVIVLILKNWRK